MAGATPAGRGCCGNSGDSCHGGAGHLCRRKSRGRDAAGMATPDPCADGSSGGHRMRALCVGLVLLLVTSTPVRAAQPMIVAAEHAAAAGDYPTAARNYEQVLERDGFSAPVLFNLGNACLLYTSPSRAILDYERALVLAPRSAAIEANLTAAPT